MFIEPGWQHSVIALLTAINAIAGAPNNMVPLSPLSAHDIVEIGEALRNGSYQPDRWFGPQGARPLAPTISNLVPSIEPKASYVVIVASNALSGLEMISKRSGGILYEDPFYALLASFNLGRYGAPWAEVLVANRATAWMQRPAIVDELARGLYRPERYFHLAGPIMVGPGEQYLSTHGAAGSELLHLQGNGRADASLDGTDGQLYLIYKYKLQAAPLKVP
jgi:hypothetical protein